MIWGGLVDNITKEFNDRIYRLSKVKFSSELISQVKNCLIDYIGVALAGSSISKHKVEDYINNNPGCISLIGLRQKVSLHSAVMLNAYNAHILELDDGHRMGMLHIGAPVFSGLLGVAEANNCSMKDLFRGAIIGYETTIRLARAIQPSHKMHGFHATGTCGTIGCAMGIAGMFGYNEQEMLNTMGAAATSAAGLLEVITGKSEQKAYNVANAANAGVNAALFGKYFEGPENILGGTRGFLKNYSEIYDEEQLLQDDTGFAINGIYMKPYAACRHCHAPIEAAIAIGKDEETRPDDIQEVVVDTYDLAVFGHDHREIDGINSAKMSIPYGVASALLFQNAGLEMFTNEMIKNKDILDLARKVTVNANDELSSLAPAKRAAVVCVRYKDGYEQKIRVDYPKGEPENPIGDGELVEKFNSLALSSKMSKEHAEKIYEFIKNAENIEVRKLFEIINGEEK